MDCLRSRRLLLAAPRELSSEHWSHIADCRRCQKLAKQIAVLEWEIERRVMVPLPDALAHRILLRRRAPSIWQHAAAAVVALAASLAALVGVGNMDAPEFTATAHAVGPTHPAVVAIAEVVEVDALPERAPSDVGELAQEMKRLGLTFDAARASARYIGKCHIDETTDCDRIVVSTRDVHANVMLVRDYPIKDRVLVEDRRMVALMGPARQGGYIVVAQSPQAAKRVEKLLVRG